jgi:quercetin dioxygenase-like cupin family protein
LNPNGADGPNDYVTIVTDFHNEKLYHEVNNVKGSVQMVEQVFKLAKGNVKVIEKVIHDENVHYNHMILNKGEGLPEHFSNSTVYMTVLTGTLSIGLGDEPVNVYESGTLLKIPFNVKMNVKNLHDEVLELIVLKAPAPQN